MADAYINQKKTVHIVADFYGIRKDIISHMKPVKKILREAIEKAKLSVIGSRFFQFNPHGVTGIFLLKESHVSIHTWPEYGYAAIDIFTCKDDESAFIAYNYLLEKLKPKKVKKRIIIRELWKK
ncbi:MAG: adenosylmethionine decarboxylase [candidate division WOR-3 bacterium]|nr:adenosylmethionine decarboxylase [candidate division WOR-3 bacterium]